MRRKRDQKIVIKKPVPYSGT